MNHQSESIKKRADRVADAVEKWLSPGNTELAAAIDRTVEEKLFSRQDIEFQLRALRQTLTRSELRRWVGERQPGSGEAFAGGKASTVEKSSAGEKDFAGQEHSEGGKALCLHAGNLPLVGVQDLLAVALSGYHYTGKVSRKDPWLLPTLIDKLREEEVLSRPEVSADLQELSGAEADRVLFAGSGRSVERVRDEIKRLGLARGGARFLVRTAHYSMAVIRSDSPVTINSLMESVLRFGGKGCRSVAVVFAPFGLNSGVCDLTDYAEAFWVKNPQHDQPPASLRYRYAYNKAAEHCQIWLEDFLFEETRMRPEESFVLHWLQGGIDEAVEFIQEFGGGLQTLYLDDPLMEENAGDIVVPGLTIRSEPLKRAHQPPVDWQPDGVDPLEWLLTEV